MSFDDKFELDVVATAIQDPTYRQQAARMVQPRHFSNKDYEWLWTHIVSLPPGEKYTGELCAAHAKMDFPKDEERRREVITVGLKAFKHEAKHARASLDQLRRFIKWHNIKVGVGQAISALDGNDPDKAGTQLRKALDMRDDMSYERAEWGDLQTRMDRRKAVSENPDLSYKVPTSLSRLDSALGGGLKPEDLGLIVGVTGVGKSQLAMMFACVGATRGFNVIYIDTENGIALSMDRADAWLYGVDSALLSDHNLSTSELETIRRKIETRAKDIKNKLFVYHASVKNATIQTIEQILSECESEGHPCQLLVVDCGDHIKPTERNKEIRLEAANVFWELKGIADTHKIPVWSTAQASKEAVGQIATSENVSEAYDKSRIATVVLTVNQTKRQESEGKGNLFLAKNRKNKARLLMPVLIDKSTSHFEHDTTIPGEDDDE